MQKLRRETNMDIGVGLAVPGMMPGFVNPVQVQGVPGAPQIAQSHYVVLSNLFDPTTVNLSDEPNFFKDTKEDVFEECSNFGKVEDVYVDQHSTGNVWVKFANNNWQAARAAVEGLNGRWFASRPINAQLIPENYFEENVKKLEI
jgi:hypothetical protein